MTRKPRTCLKCSSSKVIPIAYGYLSSEMIEELERGEIILGGCVITDEIPLWHCGECEHEWK